VRLAGGCLTLLALLAPLSKLTALPDLPFARWRQQTSAQVEAAQEQNRALEASSVGGALASYIEQRAAEQGISCTAVVHMSVDESNCLVTDAVSVSGSLSKEEIAVLTDLIAQECGIPAYLQEYSSTRK
jgi:hypothetical protein